MLLPCICFTPSSSAFVLPKGLRERPHTHTFNWPKFFYEENFIKLFPAIKLADTSLNFILRYAINFVDMLDWSKAMCGRCAQHASIWWVCDEFDAGLELATIVVWRCGTLPYVNLFLKSISVHQFFIFINFQRDEGGGRLRRVNRKMA